MTKLKKFSKIAVENRRAKYLYFIEDTIEAGVVLNGEEIQSIRKGKVSIDNGYAAEKNNDIWMYNTHIQISNNITKINSEYERDPLRPRKLLLKRREIDKIKIKLHNHGYTLIPLNIHYNNKGFAKIELGLSKGRKKEDKREYKKEQDWKREKDRLISKNIK